MGPISCSETGVINYQHALRNNPEERSSQLRRNGNLKSHILIYFLILMLLQFICLIWGLVLLDNVKVKLKRSRYSPGVAQRVGRGIALLFHNRGTRRGWVVSSTPRLHFTRGKDPVPILQEAGWAPGPVWTGGKSRTHWNFFFPDPGPSSP